MFRTTLALATTLSLLPLAAGCGSLFGQKQLEQCRGESERLVVEYRAERDARQQAEIEKRALAGRVADLEKRLALIQDAASDPRLATRPAPVPPTISPAISARIAPAAPKTAPDPWRAIPAPAP